MKCIVISPPTFVEQELDTVRGLIDLGIDGYHFRKPDLTIDEISRSLEDYPDDVRSQIVIHGVENSHLVAVYGLKGVHHRSDSNFSNQINFHQSKSFHSLEELLQIKENYQYVFLSPVFNSISKSNYLSNFSLETLKSEVPMIQQNCIALGGISEDNLLIIKDFGFTGFALLGSVWSPSSWQERIAKYQKIKVLSKKI